MPVRPPRQTPRPCIDKRALLERHPIFAGLGSEMIDRLAAHAVTQVAKAGALLFSKGDPGSSLYAVCAGQVKISVPSADGRDAVFNLINAGEVFGEIALFDGGSRTASATTMTDCELMLIERRDFVPLLMRYPELGLRVIDVLCGRLRRTSEQVEDTLFLDLPGRLAKVLLRLSAKGAPSARKIAVTQRELSNIIGMSRESTNKQLRAWANCNWVKLERGGIAVLQPEELARVLARASQAALP
jgi:CRP-like cAMP-binding protein